jgi:hypothetical protein
MPMTTSGPPAAVAALACQSTRPHSVAVELISEGVAHGLIDIVPLLDLDGQLFENNLRSGPPAPTREPPAEPRSHERWSGSSDHPITSSRPPWSRSAPAAIPAAATEPAHVGQPGCLQDEFPTLTALKRPHHR